MGFPIRKPLDHRRTQRATERVANFFRQLQIRAAAKNFKICEQRPDGLRSGHYCQALWYWRRLTKRTGQTLAPGKPWAAWRTACALENRPKTADPLPVIRAGLAPNFRSFRVTAASWG